MYPEGLRVCMCPPLSCASDFMEKPTCLSSVGQTGKKEMTGREKRERERGGARAWGWRSDREDGYAVEMDRCTRVIV